MSRRPSSSCGLHMQSVEPKLLRHSSGSEWLCIAVRPDCHDYVIPGTKLTLVQTEYRSYDFGVEMDVLLPHRGLLLRSRVRHSQLRRRFQQWRSNHQDRVGSREQLIITHQAIIDSKRRSSALSEWRRESVRLRTSRSLAAPWPSTAPTSRRRTRSSPCGARGEG